MTNELICTPNKKVNQDVFPNPHSGNSNPDASSSLSSSDASTPGHPMAEPERSGG
jgi:hypothetical protein